ncbi:MAG TPA: RNA polymerase subunit sigma-70 [Polyangia bacterium]|nr:RNA polymerase subunit sigma-70 [Polyangia bacterium]
MDVVDEDAFKRLVAPYRRELAAHCYRMAGSLHDAEDLVQESLLRAWRGLGGFEQRASLRTWLYRVATNACLDALEQKGRAPRLMPMDLAPANGPMEAPRAEPIWREPCPAPFWADAPASPEARYTAKESVALAFLVALQKLPPRPRAMLLLCDVLGYAASECAELMGTSVAAVNSGLQRAREALADGSRARPRPPADAETRALLAKYVDAWERADVGALVALLHEDATLAMPPIPTWLRGAREIGASLLGMVLPPEARGRFRGTIIEANGAPAVAVYERAREANGTDGWRPASLHVVAIDDARITDVAAFLDPTLFALFGLA